MKNPPRTTPTLANTLLRRSLAVATLFTFTGCSQAYLARHEPSWMVSSAGRQVDVAIGRIKDVHRAYADSVCATIYYRAMSPPRDSTADANGCRKYEPQRTEIWRGKE